MKPANDSQAGFLPTQQAKGIIKVDKLKALPGFQGSAGEA
jgi:hypothetical protein